MTKQQAGAKLQINIQQANIKEERTFVLLKPDAVQRGLVGEIVDRFERRGLKIIGLKMIHASREQIDAHYPISDAWLTRVGEKTLSTYEKYNMDAKAELGTNDPKKIGVMVRGWLVDFMTSGPMVKIVVQGIHAIDMVRKLAGNTIPAFAEMGTIRGDYSVDSAASANRDHRAIYNLIHASETIEEATHELDYWMSPEDIFTYKRSDDEVAFPSKRSE